MPVDEDGSIPGLTPVRALAVTPCLSLSLSLIPALSLWPHTPPSSLPHFSPPVTSLIFLSRILYCPLLSLFFYSFTYHCQPSYSVSSLSFSSLLNFFGHSFPHFPLAYYLLLLSCPLCGFTPSISCFLFTNADTASSHSPFSLFHPCFFLSFLVLLLVCYFYSITLLTLPAP